MPHVTLRRASLGEPVGEQSHALNFRRLARPDEEFDAFTSSFFSVRNLPEAYGVSRGEWNKESAMIP